MEPELIPRAPDGEGRAVATAIEQADLGLEAADDAYDCAWRSAGLREGVARHPGGAPGLGPEPSLL